MGFLGMKGLHLLHTIMLAAGRMIMVERWFNLDARSPAPLRGLCCRQNFGNEGVNVYKGPWKIPWR
jgi:hypothetical protein